MTMIQLYVLVCDVCGDCDHSLGQESESELHLESSRQGWGSDPERGDICPDCIAEEGEDP